MKTPLENKATARSSASAPNEMLDTVADTEDARIIERAKQAHGKRPRFPWAQAKQGSV